MRRNIPRHSQRLPPPYMGADSNNNFARSYDQDGYQVAPKPITQHPFPLVLEFNPIERRPWRPWTGDHDDTDSEEGTIDEYDVDYESGFAGAAAPADTSDDANNAVSEDYDAFEEGPDASEAPSGCEDSDNSDSNSQCSSDSLDEHGDYKYFDFNSESNNGSESDEESEEKEKEEEVEVEVEVEVDVKVEESEEVQACTVWEERDRFENVEDSQGSEEDYDADNDESRLRYAMREIARQLIFWLPFGFFILKRLIMWSVACLTSNVIPFVYHLTKSVWLKAESQRTFWMPMILNRIMEFLDWSKIQFLNFIPYGYFWMTFTLQCVKQQINKLISATKAIMNW